MSKREKALIILPTPFILGFLLGLLVGGGCSKVEREPKEKKVRMEQTEPQEILQEEAGVPDVPETLQTEDDVDGLGEVEAREIIYYVPRMPYAKLFGDVTTRTWRRPRRSD